MLPPMLKASDLNYGILSTGHYRKGKSSEKFWGIHSFHCYGNILFIKKNYHALSILTITLMLDSSKQLWRLLFSEVLWEHNLLGYEEKWVFFFLIIVFFFSEIVCHGNLFSREPSINIWINGLLVISFSFHIFLEFKDKNTDNSNTSGL